MKTNLEITTTDKAGLLSKVSLALAQKGYKIVTQGAGETDDENTGLLRFEIESQQGFKPEDGELLKSELADIVAIREITDSSAAASPEAKALLDRYGPQLIKAYPAIPDQLKTCAGELPAALKDDVLTRLGKGLGRWQYKQNYALGGLLPLDKTLQRMLWPSLADFMDIESSGNQVSIKDCPVCATHADGACHFFAAYIDGFLAELDHLPTHSVTQVETATNGSPKCTFEVRGETS